MRPCVIATSRPWNEPMALRLQERLERPFILMKSPSELTEEALAAIDPEWVFFPHWSHIIPEPIHTRFRCVIFHMTDLPFGRGGSPLQNLIARGIAETRISALLCERELDAGPVFAKRPLSLHGSAEEIFIRASGIIEAMIEELVRTSPEPQEQQGTPVVFKRRTPEESNLAGLETLSRLFDHIRMLDAPGYPHAFLEYGRFRFEFTGASLKENQLVAAVTITEKTP